MNRREQRLTLSLLHTQSFGDEAVDALDVSAHLLLLSPHLIQHSADVVPKFMQEILDYCVSLPALLSFRTNLSLELDERAQSGVNLRQLLLHRIQPALEALGESLLDILISPYAKLGFSPPGLLPGALLQEERLLQACEGASLLKELLLHGRGHDCCCHTVWILQETRWRLLLPGHSPMLSTSR